MLRHADSFAFYAGGQIARLYADIGLTGTLATGPYGRLGGPGLRFSAGFSDYVARHAVPAVGATCIYEFDLRVSAAPATANVLCSIYDGATIQATLAITPALALAVYRDQVVGGTLLGTLGYTVTPGSMIHVSWKTTIGNSGASAIKVYTESSVTVPVATLTLTGVDTQMTGAAQWDGLEFGAGCAGTTDYANAIVLDGSGGRLNDHLGPVDVWTLRANTRTPGEVQTFGRSSGTDPVALVQDGIPDDDLTYLFGDAGVHVLAVDPVPFPDRAILGLQACHGTRKTGAGSPAIQSVVRQAGVTTHGVSQAPASTFGYLLDPYSALPDSSVMTAAAVDALQWGLEV